jgi:hypothetical protein
MTINRNSQGLRKDVDYPGILPYSQSKRLFGRELSPGERSVQGTLVTGLTAQDMRLLDDFEIDVSVPTATILAYVYRTHPRRMLGSACQSDC